MGFFGGKQTETLPTDTAKAVAAQDEPAKPLKTTKPTQKKKLTEAEKQQQQHEKEELDLALLVAGAPDVDAQLRAQKRFMGSNARHMYVDGLLGTAVYTFSGLQHITGQSNALTLLSMWAAGTTFLINAGLRHYLNDVTRGLTMAPTTIPATSTDITASTAATTTPINNRLESTKTTQKGALPKSEPVSAAAADTTVAQGAVSVVANAGLLADYDTQRRNVFQLEAVASWVWMLAALQQFRVHKRLRWCGYSSWSGLACVAYYSMRYMYNVLVD